MPSAEPFTTLFEVQFTNVGYVDSDPDNMIRSDIVEVNAADTFLLIGGTGTPESFLPTGDQRTNPETVVLVAVSEVPEPSACSLILGAIFGFALSARRFRRRRVR